MDEMHGLTPAQLSVRGATGGYWAQRGGSRDVRQPRIGRHDSRVFEYHRLPVPDLVADGTSG